MPSKKNKENYLSKTRNNFSMMKSNYMMDYKTDIMAKVTIRGKQIERLSLMKELVNL